MKHELVAGESVDALRRAVAAFEWKRRSNGWFRASVQLDRDLGDPLRRALMRVEAELLAKDADAIGRSDTAVRTVEQRRADALVALGLRLADAR
jgi:hypothetical protein